MNPLYQQLMNNTSMQQPQVSNINPNPIQKMDFIRKAMANPGLLIKQRFPDIPDNIMQDPNAILLYLQRTRGITNQQIQQLMQTYGR